MDINLDQEVEIDPGDATYQAMLENLQGNILTSHHRTHVRLVLLRFQAESEDLRGWIRSVVIPRLTWTAAQLTGNGNGTFGSFFLTATGYEKLGFPRQDVEGRFPDGTRFAGGMAALAGELGDPDPAGWEDSLNATTGGPLDAMLLLADNDRATVEDALQEIATSFAGLGRVDSQIGEVTREPNPPAGEPPQPVEPFGYVDGRSQPRFFKADLDRERASGGIDRWNPLAPLGLVLVPDPFTKESDCYGSFLVFRKLAQNVTGFGENVEDLAAAGVSEDLTGAQVVGRFKDGTTVLRGAPAAGPTRLCNNFDYSGLNGAACPVQAHVRAANLRTSEDRMHRIVRRGVRYSDLNGEGMLFMCYQASITEQFEFMQKRLTASGNDAFNNAITLRGGELFFAPSQPFLRGL